MADQPSDSPVFLAPLLSVLDDHLIGLLHQLEPNDWQQPTVARLWTVKDVAAHLLDGNIRILSMLRDQYSSSQPAANGYDDLVIYLNQLNADWVKAMQRVSPAVLVMLHEVTGPLFCQYYQQLDPMEEAAFSVSWAGQSKSPNWMHIAREYTEKWLHQQQIREATNRPGILTQELFYPFIRTLLLGMPHALRQTQAETGTLISLTVGRNHEPGGTWAWQRQEFGWTAAPVYDRDDISASVTLDAHVSWKLFSKSIRPEALPLHSVTISGDAQLAQAMLNMVSVMA